MKAVANFHKHLRGDCYDGMAESLSNPKDEEEDLSYTASSGERLGLSIGALVEEAKCMVGDGSPKPVLTGSKGQAHLGTDRVVVDSLVHESSVNAVTFICSKHGKVTASPDSNRDVYCPKCRESWLTRQGTYYGPGGADTQPIKCARCGHPEEAHEPCDLQGGAAGCRVQYNVDEARAQGTEPDGCECLDFVEEAPLLPWSEDLFGELTNFGFHLEEKEGGVSLRNGPDLSQTFIRKLVALVRGEMRG